MVFSEDTNARDLLGTGSLSEKVKTQPRQLLNRWAASSGGLSSWGGWIWRSLSAGHELAVHQTQIAAHLVCSQGSSWYFPAVCVAGNNSRIFTLFGSCCLLAKSWNRIVGMVTRTLQSFPDHANGHFNGLRGPKLERWCCPGFLTDEEKNNKAGACLYTCSFVIAPLVVCEACCVHMETVILLATRLCQAQHWAWSLWEALGFCRKGLFLFFFWRNSVLFSGILSAGGIFGLQDCSVPALENLAIYLETDMGKFQLIHPSCPFSRTRSKASTAESLQPAPECFQIKCLE